MLDTLGIFATENDNTMVHTREQFAQAENNWDLENLYRDLASAKGKNLTPMEKLHLRGLLCGCSPAEMAKKLHKTLNGLEVDLSNTVYQYVKNFLNHDGEEGKVEKVGNWRNICQWLENEGYKCQQTVQYQTSQSQSNQFVPVDAQVKIENIKIENQKIKMDIGVLIQLVVPLPPDSPKEDSLPIAKPA